MSFENTDLWKFTAEHHDAEVKTWGGFIGKDDGFTPFGWTVSVDGTTHYFGLDGKLIKTKAE